MKNHNYLSELPIDRALGEQIAF